MAKPKRDDVPFLSITKLRVRGAVRPTDHAVTLEFPNGEWHHVKIVHTPHRLMASRPNPLFCHFECPHCRKKAKKLRWLDDWDTPRCRSCDGLTQSRGDPALVVQRLREKLYGPNPPVIRRDSVELSLRLAEIRQREFELKAHGKTLRQLARGS
jgi:hypothetical protein